MNKALSLAAALWAGLAAPYLVHAAETAGGEDRAQALERRVEQLEQRLRELTGAAAPAAAEDAPPLGAEEQQENERLVRAAFERTLIDRGGLLLPPYQMEVEPSLSYAHSSTDTIVIDGFTIFPVLVVGDIYSQRIRRDSAFFTLSARLGLPRDYQVELRLPYSHERSRSLTADNEEINRDNSGLGDIQLSLSHQLRRGHGGVDVLGSLRWKTRSGDDPYDPANKGRPALGSGFDSLELSLTAVKVSDPAVFFCGGAYTHTLKDAKPDLGTVQPGDSTGVQLGMALALNLDTSLRFGLDQRYTQRTRIDGNGVAGSYLTTATFTLGVTYVLGDKMSLDTGIGIGLTQDTPDVQLDVALPVRLP